MNTYSPAAQVIIAIIPIVAIGFGAIIVFFALLWRHREVKTQIKLGTYRQRKFNLKAFCLFTGIMLIGVGSVLTFMFFALNGLTWSLLGGLIPFVLGVDFLIFYKSNPDFKNKLEDN